MDDKLSKHGGPQSWAEMRRGIQRRKATVKQRNAQIWDLKGRIASRDALIKELMEALEIIIDSWTNVSLGAQEIYDCKKVLVKAKEALEKK